MIELAAVAVGVMICMSIVGLNCGGKSWKEGVS